MNVAVRTLSICTGGGGIELGLELVCPGLFVPVAYAECETYAAALLAKRMEEKALPEAPVWSDVRTLCDAGFRDFMEGIDLGLITGGYPCQPFSVAGKQRGEDDPRHLWPRIAEAVALYQPELCFFENVAGHLNLGFDSVLSDLRKMGYRVAAGLFTAAEVGISMEKGIRLFVLGASTSDDGDVLLQSGRQKEAGIDVGGASQILGSSKTDGHDKADTGFTGFVFGARGIALAPQGVHQEPWEEKRYLESRVGRATDGVAFRVERLRMLGNGVVPLQAAYAFVSLAACLWEGD